MKWKKNFGIAQAFGFDFALRQKPGQQPGF
jgi:hypothetical protein